ncbi:Serum paraoxonase/arylesterase 2-like protein [Cladobotryum mycophilum]|uniref:Serum paraoxonase/arylesterase 2-like protein n=1 Tax=Cladobotryum mycophilum TaxID=491253 RepID=A0ABR0STN7_9HYPO
MAGFLNPRTVPLIVILCTYLYNYHLQRPIKVLGIFRTPNSTVVPEGDFFVIEDTTHCEDLHYYPLSNEIFTACESSYGTRHSWFPALEHLNVTGIPLNGNLQVIDARTHKSRTLVLEGFDGSFVTHGIDVISDPEKPEGEAVYIFAVNHLPNPEHFGENGNPEAPKARSVVEVFHHALGSNTAKHIRTVWDPLVTTPNDIVAVSPNSFFVTNDHFHREGFLRVIEDIFLAIKWTNTIYVEFTGPASPEDDSKGVKASVALENMHNNNGLGHGRTPDEAVIVECSSGEMNIGLIRDKVIEVKDKILLDTVIDNPSYFSDPYADETFDASGYVNCGSTQPVHFAANKGKWEATDAIMVLKTSPAKKGDSGDEASKWDTKLIFEDDGHRIRTCSSAVLVAIDPKEEGASDELGCMRRDTGREMRLPSRLTCRLVCRCVYLSDKGR